MSGETPQHMVVDCEYHPLIASIDDLLPHLDPTWARRMTTSEFKLPPAALHLGVDVEARTFANGADPGDAARTLPDAVESALLIAPQALVTSGWLSHSLATVFTAAVNDYVLDRWISADDRFRLAVTVSPHDGDAAAEEIRRLGEHPATAAICMSLIAINMGQRHYHPIYEAAQELELPLVVHPAGSEGTVLGPAMLPGAGPRRPEEGYTLLPQVAISNMASLIYDGIFEQFPRLKVVFAGFGFDWAVSTLWRTHQEWRNMRAEVPWLTRTPLEYAETNLRLVVDGAARPLHDDAWKLADMLPAGMLLYGSDTPFVEGAPAERLAGAPESLRARVLRGNALETYPRLSVPA